MMAVAGQERTKTLLTRPTLSVNSHPASSRSSADRLVGHSSGGHLALWLAARQKLPADSALYAASPLRVAGVVDIDGPPDLESVIAIERKVCGGPVVEQLLGGTPTELPGRYRQASATALLPIAAKQELLIGDELDAEWIKTIKWYAATARNAGDPVTVTMLQNAGHFDGLIRRRRRGRQSLPAFDDRRDEVDGKMIRVER